MQSFKNANRIDRNNKHQLYEQSRTISLPHCLFAAAKPVAGSAKSVLTVNGHDPYNINQKLTKPLQPIQQQQKNQPYTLSQQACTNM